MANAAGYRITAPTGGGMSLDAKLQQKAAAVQRAAGPATGVTSAAAPETKMVKAPGPATGVSSEPAKADPVMVRPNATPTPSEGALVPPKPPVAAPPPVKSSFDLQREQVAADRVAEEARREAAVERYFSNRGLGDSGILAGAERAERANVAAEAGRALSGIGQEESRQAFTAGQADIDRKINQEQFTAGLNQAKELTLAGLDIQKSTLALQEKGMKAEDARFYASLSQADRHAQMGFTLEESRLDLQKQGMSQQDAQYYAGLGQARYLAEKGFGLEETRTELQRLGLSMQEAQFYAAQAHDKDMFNLQTKADIQKGFLAAGLDKVKFDTPEGVAAFNALLKTWGLEAYALPVPAAKPAAAPASSTSTSIPQNTGRTIR